MTEDSTTQISVKKTTGWFEWVRNYLPTIVLITAGVLYVGGFFNTGKSDHADIINIKLELQALEKDKATNEALKALQDQVNRQYQVNSDDKVKENAAIEEVADYMHEQIGYQKAVNDTKQKTR
jgi:hypothetical protein